MQSPAMIFERREEPNERAFSLLTPQGWLIEGGITRANLMNQVVNIQSIEAKLDMAVKRDTTGSVMLRWCPEIKYSDPRWNMAAQWGMFPIGSNYNGTWVYPVMPAVQFLIQMLFPWAHPQASQVQVINQQRLPAMVEQYKQKALNPALLAHFAYDGGTVTFTYVEAGRHYQEKAFTVIEDMGQLAAGMWSNNNTHFYRAPVDQFETWEPVLTHIHTSSQINHAWLAQEVVSQEFLSRAFINAQQAAQARAQRLLEVQRQLQEMDRQILEHRQRTYAEIRNDAYLNLTNQEEYVNPYTRQVDIGSNQWRYRWVNESGDEFYTDNNWDDPNTDSMLNRSDWQRSEVRPRFPQ